MNIEPLPCPMCGGGVLIGVSSDGSLYEHSTYAAECRSCGMKEDYFGIDGTKRSATRHYNRWAKSRIKEPPQ